MGRLRQRALVAVLALEAGRAVDIDRLVACLWADNQPASPRASLQTAASSVRAALAPLTGGARESVLVSTGHGYLLAVPRGCVDALHAVETLDEARHLLDAGRAGDSLVKARSALALWSGEALSEFGDLPFAVTESARFAELRVGAAELCAQALLALGRPAEAAIDIASLAGLHPLRESVVELEMLALYRSGRQADALRAYQSLRLRLADQAGLLPSRRLQALEAAILAQDPSLEADHPGPASAGPAPSQPPSAAGVPAPADRPFPAAAGPPPPALQTRRRVALAGRRSELATLEAAWQRASTGRRQVAGISGEPGIGKTRLAGELAQAVVANGGSVMAGRCRRQAVLPYEPVAEALLGFAASQGADRLASHAGGRRSELARVLPSLFPDDGGWPEPAAGQGEDRFRLFEAVSATLASIASGATLVLVVDDAHWADRSTVLLLHHLACHPEPSALLLLLTYRDAPTELSAELADMMADLDRQGRLEKVTLAGLGMRDIGDLVRSQAGQEPPKEFLQAIEAETRGNPFFVEEIIGQLLDGGDDAPPLGDTAVLERMGAPSGVDSLIRSRIAGLSPAAARVVDLLSLAVARIDADAMSAVLGIDRENVVAGLAEAGGANLVVADDGGNGLVLSHPLVRDTIAAAVPTLERVRLHERLARHLEEGEAPAGALAHHWYEARSVAGPARAARYCERAGDEALHQLAYEDAALHYRRACELIDAGAPDPSARARVLVHLADALARAGETAGARQVVPAAIEAARAVGNPVWEAEAALTLAGPATLSLPDPEVVMALEAALAALGDRRPGVAARVLARLAMERCFGDFASSEALSARAVAAARQAGDPRTLITVLGNRHFVLGPDRLVEQEALASEMLALAVETGDRESEVTARHYHLLDRLALTDIGGVDQEQRLLEALVAELRQPRYLWQVAVYRAMRALLAGRLEEAEHLAAEALETGQRSQADNALNAYAAQLFVLRLHQGRLAELEPALWDYAAASPFVPAWRAALALALAHSGRHEASAAMVAELGRDGFKSVPRDTNWLVTLTLLGEAVSRSGDARKAADLLSILAPAAGRNVVVGAGFACLGAVDRVVGELAVTTGDWERAQQAFRSARVIHRRMGAAAWLQWTETGLATLERHQPAHTTPPAHTGPTIDLAEVEAGSETPAPGGPRR
ncbi:MAG TPA: BTAD domain-containing putative transcriptional regulator [Acidimicrobiales bacterium]|nr:BTAD domain-containing putative transcriptional regulator [Acidimicrobiales bacterium]